MNYVQTKILEYENLKIYSIMNYCLPFRNEGKVVIWLSGKNTGVVNDLGNVLRYGNQNDPSPSDFSCNRSIVSDTWEPYLWKSRNNLKNRIHN